MVGAVGGGIFAKTAKTPPLQSALRDAIAIQMSSHRRLHHAQTFHPAYLFS